MIQIKTVCHADIIFRRSALLIDGKYDVSTQQVTAASFPREEALQIAGLLALTGGYLKAYTWIVHRVFANAQSANLVFLWVYVTEAEWEKALHYVPPLFAFAVGVILACWLRRLAPLQAARISLLIEIFFCSLSRSSTTGFPNLQARSAFRSLQRSRP